MARDWTQFDHERSCVCGHANAQHDHGNKCTEIVREYMVNDHLCSCKKFKEAKSR